MNTRDYPPEKIPHSLVERAIICINDEILLIGPLETNFSEILIRIQTFSFKKMHLKMSSAKMASILSRPQCVNQDHHIYQKMQWNDFPKILRGTLVWLPDYIQAIKLCNVHLALWMYVV